MPLRGKSGWHRDEHLVRSYDVDTTGRLAPPALWRMLQDAAGSSAAALGFSVEHLFEHGLTWVLARFRLGMRDWPGWRSPLAVETWPVGTDGVRAYRNFRVRDGAGRMIGAASSLWMVLDVKARRPVRIPEFIRMARPGDADMTHADVADEAPELLDALDLAPLAAPPAARRERRMTVRFNDLDLNRHANNACYTEWALEAVPPELREAATPCALAIDYRAEARLDDPVVSSCAPAGEGDAAFAAPCTVLHRIAHAEGRDFALARSVWR